MNLPDGKKVIGSCFTYSVKTTGDSQWYKDKARFIVQGFIMIAGEHYTETWAAVTRLKSIRMTAVFTAAYRLIPWQIDFISAYLNSEIKEEVGKEELVCKLNKALYGMKQGTHEWWNELNHGYNGIGYYASKAVW